ncbi:MAG: SHOCT domain-containing protein [Synechococcales cyanobacterium M58_A2018_015]|nr:SHOCT domain-containing protein [Synechococcales cyanobacterium M58_A2018_015]
MKLSTFSSREPSFKTRLQRRCGRGWTAVAGTRRVSNRSHLTQLTQLAQLKEAGALTEAEFQQAKAKLLA